MSITVTCPNCKVLFRLGEEMAGTKVRCAKCEHIFTVAVGASKPRTKVDPEETTVTASAAPPPPVAAAAPDDDDDLDRSARSRRSRDRDYDDDDDDRSRYSRRREPEPAPRRKKKTAGGSNTTMWVLVIGGLGLGALACLGCGGAVIVWALMVGDNAAPPNMPRDAIHARLNMAGSFRDNNRLNLGDANFRNHICKLYVVHLEAGRTYQIDHMSGDFDAFLFLCNNDDVFLAADDDGGVGLNSRITFRPDRTGFYRIRATSLGGRNTGRYSLQIQRR